MNCLGTSASFENMTKFLCPHCNETSQIFPGSSGEEESKRLDVPLLGQIYLSPEIAQSADDGIPYILKNEDSPITREYEKIASQLEKLSEKSLVETLRTIPV